MTMAYVVLFGLVVLLALIPLLPSIREWRRPTDTAALSVAQASAVDIGVLAKRFRAWVDAHFAAPLALARRTGAFTEGRIGNDSYRVAAMNGRPVVTPAEQSSQRLDTVVLVSRDLELPANLTVAKELFVEGSLRTGAAGIYRAILAGGDVALGDRTRVLRWLHAEGSVHLGVDCHAHGRISAGRAITVGPGSAFERMHAPRIEFGAVASGPPPAPDRALPPLEPAQAGPGTLVDVGAGRWLVEGDFETPPDVALVTDLVVTGTCKLGRGVVVTGSVKSRGDLVLGEGVQVRGAVVGERDVHCGSHCFVTGPVIAEGTAYLAPGVRIGEPGRPTTLSAQDVRAVPGAAVFGTVWAHRRGALAAEAA